MNSSASAPSGSYPSASQLHGCPTAALETPRPYSMSHGAYNTAVAAYNMTSPYSSGGLPHMAFGSNNFMVPLPHSMFSSYNGKFLDKLLILLLFSLLCSSFVSLLSCHYWAASFPFATSIYTSFFLISASK